MPSQDQSIICILLKTMIVDCQFRNVPKILLLQPFENLYTDGVLLFQSLFPLKIP